MNPANKKLTLAFLKNSCFSSIFAVGRLSGSLRRHSATMRRNTLLYALYCSWSSVPVSNVGGSFCSVNINTCPPPNSLTTLPVFFLIRRFYLASIMNSSTMAVCVVSSVHTSLGEVVLYARQTANIRLNWNRQLYAIKEGSKMIQQRLMYDKTYLFIYLNMSLQCFDTVGWATGRASGL